jgi:putative sterol carrier protein
MPNVPELMAALPGRFDPEVAPGLNAVIQFELSPEEDGGPYIVTIRDGACQIEPGSHMSPNMTLRMTAADYVDLATGKLSHQLAFMTGRLRVNGDLSLATRLRQLLALG